MDAISLQLSEDEKWLPGINSQSGTAIIVVCRLNTDACDKAIRGFGQYLREHCDLSFPLRKFRNVEVPAAKGSPKGWLIHAGMIRIIDPENY